MTDILIILGFLLFGCLLWIVGILSENAVKKWLNKKTKQELGVEELRIEK
jgi:hypothetical protein